MNASTTAATAAALCALCLTVTPAWSADNGDGTFTNPVLYADYPDPDIIRVGKDFYFATTTFVNVPGLRLLHSTDLVNWEIVSHVVPRLEGRPEYDLQKGGAYRSGVFAPSLRHHNGTFYVVVTPVGQHTRIYSAKNIRGPWQFHELDRTAFDPAFFIDTDGTGYIATSGGWDGHVTLLKLSADFARVVDSREIHFIPGAEGSHIIKRGSWYYLFNAIPRRLAMTVSRSKSLYGPWETRDQIDDRTGGHQGALVDLPDGSWYGFAMRDSGAIGRVTNLSTVFWRDDWPVWGTPEAPGKIPATLPKPIGGSSLRQPDASDTFDSSRLGLQWQWNHNPDDTRWSLTERRGFLRLRPTAATEFWTARNTLTQKGQGPRSRGEVKLDLRHLKPGDICGFGTLGKINGQIAVSCAADGKRSLQMRVITNTAGGSETETRIAAVPIEGDTLFLRTDMDFTTSTALCAYSLDGIAWTPLGGAFPLAFDWRTGTFQGQQYAIFCYNAAPGDGFVDVDHFRLSALPEAAKASDKTP